VVEFEGLPGPGIGEPSTAKVVIVGDEAAELTALHADGAELAAAL